MKWLRLYDDILDDPKVQKLPPPLFKAWINLLCLANKGETRGVLPDEIEDIAFRLRISEGECRTTLESLAQHGLIETTEDGERIPHNWFNRQPVSDDVAAKVAAHRARKAGLRSQNTVTECNETVPLHETTVLRSRGKEAEADEIQIREEAEADSARVREVAPPAAPLFVASNDSAPPLRFALSNAETNDLLASGPPGGPHWTLLEIDIGCQILSEREGKPPRDPKALLHAAILPEVRGGRRPKAQAHAPPQKKPARDEAEYERQIAENRARMQIALNGGKSP